MKISCSIDIESTPEEVFHWLDNPQRAMVWMSSVSRTEMLHQTPGVVGTTFRETIQENGQSTQLRGVITAFEPNRLIAFHLSGEFNDVDVQYRLEEVDKHTRLTQRAHVRFKSLMRVVSIAMGPVFKKKIMDQARGEFERLKELCECGPTG